ncbi:hypothetical protein LCGC14_1566030, partial [marine sediment metagenome]
MDNMEEKMTEETIKSAIHELVSERGAISLKNLRNLIKKEQNTYKSYNCAIGLITDLVTEGKVFIEKCLTRKVFYSKSNPNYKAKLEIEFEEIQKRVYYTRLKHSSENFRLSFMSKYKLSNFEKEILKELILKCNPFIYKNSIWGRKILSCYLIFNKFLVKKELFTLVKDSCDFKTLMPWLHLHELLQNEWYIDCSYKLYGHYRDLIILDPDFCEKSNRGFILDTPDNFLKMKYFLSSDGLKEKDITKILEFIEICCSKGYNFTGKDVNGVAAAGCYIYSLKNGLGKSQNEIANHFSISDVTLRSRYFELKKFLPQGEILKPITASKPKKVKSEKKISSHQEIIHGLKKVIEDVKEDFVEIYGDYNRLRDAMKFDYNSAITRRIKTIQEINKELHYDDLNDDLILKNLKRENNLKNRIMQKVEEVAKKNSETGINHVIELFLIITYIHDFALGGNSEEIASHFNVGSSSIRYTAKYFFEDPHLYGIRFYNNQNYKRDVLSIADDVNNGIIKKANFCHLTHPQFKKLLNYYRSANGISIRHSVFDLTKVSLPFAKWVYELTSDDLEEFLKDYEEKLSISEFMNLIAEINKNMEILKCLVYNLFTKSS